MYALQAVFTADHHAVHVTQSQVYGVISLVFWTLTLIVSVLYVSFIMRADDRGEGGIMSLIALLRGPTLKRTGLTMGRPVMAIWFGVLALIGIIEVAHHPGVLRALSPTYGAQFLIDHGSVAFIALASVVLAVTGAEALYADMGHFGRTPIRRAWFLLVFPALTLN